MIDNPIRMAGLLITLPLLLLLGCGNASDGAGGGLVQPPGAEAIGTVTSEVIGGYSTNVTQGLVPNSSAESETAAVTLDSPPGTTLGHFVAYNATDTTPAHVSGTKYCRGYSSSGFSYFTNGTWRGSLMPTPPGAAMLSSDPSVVYVDDTAHNRWFVYVSSLAISTSSWNAYCGRKRLY